MDVADDLVMEVQHRRGICLVVRAVELDEVVVDGVAEVVDHERVEHEEAVAGRIVSDFQRIRRGAPV